MSPHFLCIHLPCIPLIGGTQGRCMQEFSILFSCCTGSYFSLHFWVRHCSFFWHFPHIHYIKIKKFTSFQVQLTFTAQSNLCTKYMYFTKSPHFVLIRTKKHFPFCPCCSIYMYILVLAIELRIYVTTRVPTVISSNHTLVPG